MAKLTGLYFDKKTDRWIINRQHRGERIYERTQFGYNERDQAEGRLYQLIAAVEARSGPLPKNTTFREAATKYLTTAHKRSLARDAYVIKRWDELIGSTPVTHIHQGMLVPLIMKRREDGARTGTIKREIATIRVILTLCATEWRDSSNMPLLLTIPKLKCPDFEDQARPHILSEPEQRRLIQELPDHLARMALFALHTGLRDHTLSGLRWSWYQGDRFIVPGKPTSDGWKGEKTKRDHIVLLNGIARNVINDCAGKNETHVFNYNGNPITRMHNHAWKKAWIRAELPTGPDVLSGPHNLRHTFARRLEVLGVDFEVRQALLGHSSGQVTHIYSPVNLDRMQKALDLLAPRLAQSRAAVAQQ